MDNQGPADFNAAVVAEFRANGGHVGGPLTGFSLILVHHVGRRSGVERVVPLVYFPWPGGRWVIIASNGGSPTHPAWYHNLTAHPRVVVEVAGQTFRVVAEELDAAARAAVWPTIVEQSPSAGEFARTSPRTIPVFMLTPEE
jgi:deazaflavin-dependent oxidoreductase (nitroreductase family)